MSNTNQNLLNQTLAALTLTEISEALTVVESALPNGTLNDEQRRALNSINIANKVFAEEVLDEMNTNPIPAVNTTYSKEYLANDINLFEQMESIISRIKNITQKLEDIRRIAGHEAYGIATAAYYMLEGMARSGVPGAQASYDRLKVRYASNGGNQNAEPEMEI